MRTIILTFAAVSVVVFSSLAFAHGGGCRKDSPPGQCCHMDRSTGLVHCH